MNYNELSKRTKGRVNDLIQTHMDVHISQIVRDADNEAEVIQAMDDIESREVTVSQEVRLWTCRQVI